VKILVMGVTGIIGHAIWSSLQDIDTYDVWGTFRNSSKLVHFPKKNQLQLIHGIDVLDLDALINLFQRVKPDVVINCVGLIKQLASANNPLAIIPINALFPHRLLQLCSLTNSRLIHMSTDCVFSGRKGNYLESDPSDAEDLYGKSKYMGEVCDSLNAITIRTSTIGHELNTKYALVDWFLSQEEKVNGYVNAIFSGLPTVELAKVVRDYVIPNVELKGLYHVAAKPIGKYDLLKLIAETYDKKITIEPVHHVSIDRSLCAKRFEDKTGYHAPDWPTLIEKMYQSKKVVGALDV